MRALSLFIKSAIVLGLLLAARSTATTLAAASTANAPSCQWMYSHDGTGLDQPLYNDPNNTPIGNLRFGEPYDHFMFGLSRAGSLDFDFDNRADVFRAIPRGDGLLQWQYAPGGRGPWRNLAADSTPLADLRFGDFDGDGRTDVFSVEPAPNGQFHWRSRSGGLGDWVYMLDDDTPLADLRFGNFDGDFKTDVFSVVQRFDGLLQWRYSPGGSIAWQNLGAFSTPLGNLRFGNFDGDLVTDVFTAEPEYDGTYFWYISHGGVSKYDLWGWGDTPLKDIRFGDFNGDHKTDLFAAVPRPDGLLQWRYSPGQGVWHDMAYSGAPLAALRFDYFDANDFTDVFTAACGLPSSQRGFPAPFADHVLGQQTFRTSAAGTTDRTLWGPAGLAIAPNGRVFAADYKNNRILSWPDATRLNDGAPADLVIGQPGFFSDDPNRGSATPDSNSLWGPESVLVDKNGRLYVADTTNHRVLIFNGPFRPYADPRANVVIGQPGFTTGGTGFDGCATAINANFCYSRGLAIDSAGRLYVGDEFHNRVLVFAPPFKATGQLAIKVIGQPNGDFGSQEQNWTGPGGIAGPYRPNAFGLSGPRGLAIDAQDRLYVADSENNRVLIFPTPMATDPYAKFAIGQPGLLWGQPNQGKQNASVYSLNFPIDLAIDTVGNLYVSDLNNHRVLVYDLVTHFDLAADHIFGYKDSNMVCGSEPDPDPAPNRIWLRCPLGIAVDPFGTLLIADFYNNRILAYDVPIQHAFVPLIKR